jgi:hypothetical protein
VQAAGAKRPKRPVTRGQKIAAGFVGLALLCCCGSGIGAFTDSGDDKPAAQASPTAVQASPTAVQALAEPAVSASPSLTPTTSKPSPTPKPTSPKPAPKRTTAAPRTANPTTQSIRTGVHPGAFCSPAGALGRTSAGTLMQCKTSATDSRLRWRAA